MASGGFRKPTELKQSAAKIGLYGPPGCGKTWTALELMEGFLAGTGKRIALLDTEHGADFYITERPKKAPKRRLHPAPFDVDVMHTRSLTEASKEIRALDTNVYGGLIVDSETHLWEATMEAYAGNKNKAGQIPFHAWGKLKKPYKELRTAWLNSPMHVIICGRQKNIFGEDEHGETKMLGVGMRSEGETPYEPNILMRMAVERSTKRPETLAVFVEKDRTGMISGRTFYFGAPDQKDGYTFAQLGAPIAAALGGTEQAQVQTSADASHADAEALSEEELEFEANSEELRRQFCADCDAARDAETLGAINKALVPHKKQMMKEHVNECRECYTKNLARFK